MQLRALVSFNNSEANFFVRKGVIFHASEPYAKSLMRMKMVEPSTAQTLEAPLNQALSGPPLGKGRPTSTPSAPSVPPSADITIVGQAAPSPSSPAGRASRRKTVTTRDVPIK